MDPEAPSASSSRHRLAFAGAALATAPGLLLRASGASPQHWIAALVFGLAVVGAAFILAWGAEVLQLDLSQGLSIAIVALIAVLPEYAVDFVFTWKAGQHPKEFAPLALANMTGSNRLLIGIGWPLVVFIAAWRMRAIAKRKTYDGDLETDVHLERSHSVEIAFLLIATLYSLTLPLKRTLTLFDAAVLVALFGAYMIRISRAPAEEPNLIGPPLALAALPARQRRLWVGALLVFAAAVILICAEPFADSLVQTGEEFGFSTFLLVQWLAPLASEAPELLIAGMFAWRLNSQAGLGTLVSSKVNQWTLLVGTLPIVFAVSAGAFHGLPLDSLQREELFLTAAQSAFAVAVLANRRISVREAITLCTLFLSQFALGAVLPGHLREFERIGVGVLYLVLAAGILFRNRRAFIHLLEDGFRTPVTEMVREDDGAERRPTSAAAFEALIDERQS
ncbi:MAG: sodium/calcium exchanger family protein [Actinomycetia bacterium]|nr:sodium/calcium exchanger family protein [Actinomycetes bacterium]